MGKTIHPARDIALIAVFAGVTAALGIIPPIPVGPLPITAQTLGVMLAGAILGGYRGFASQLLFLALVAIGLPLLAGGRGGIGVLFGPSVGFLVGWPIVAGFMGWATYKVGAPYKLWEGIGIHLLGGIVVLYCFGIAGLMLRADMSFQKALVTNAPFLVGDTMKAVIAAVIAKGVHSAYPRLLPHRNRGAQDSFSQPEG